MWARESEGGRSRVTMSPAAARSDAHTRVRALPLSPLVLQHDDAVDARANRVVRTVTDGYKVRVWCR